MTFFFDDAAFRISELNENQSFSNECQNFDNEFYQTYFPSLENPNLNPFKDLNDCNYSMFMKTSNNNIEENQDLNQKATSDKTQEKKEENIKKDDEKPFFMKSQK